MFPGTEQVLGQQSVTGCCRWQGRGSQGAPGSQIHLPQFSTMERGARSCWGGVPSGNALKITPLSMAGIAADLLSVLQAIHSSGLLDRKKKIS